MPIIAEIKLAPGEVGYYDEYSRIYLSSSNPRAVIYAGMNCTQIKRSIRSGRLILISGGFDNIPVEPDMVEQLKKQVQKEEEKAIKTEIVEEAVIAEEKTEQKQQTEVIEETKESEEVKETVQEKEVKEECPAKAENQVKKARKTRAAKTKEAAE